MYLVELRSLYIVYGQLGRGYKYTDGFLETAFIIYGVELFGKKKKI